VEVAAVSKKKWVGSRNKRGWEKGRGREPMGLLRANQQISFSFTVASAQWTAWNQQQTCDVQPWRPWRWECCCPRWRVPPRFCWGMHVDSLSEVPADRNYCFS